MEYTLLKNIAVIMMGQSPSSSSYNEEGVGIPFYQGNADFGELYPTARIWCNDPKKIANKNDILISVRAPIGALNYATEQCCIGRGLASITVKDEVLRNYVFRLLKANRNKLINQGSGSTFKAIGKSNLEELRIPIVDEMTQKKIMNLMDATEQIIRQRQIELQLFDDLIKARFIELFGDPKINDKSWDIGIISDYYEVKGGKRIPKGMGYTDAITTHPYLRASDMKNGTIIDDDIHYIDDEVYEHIKRYIVNGGDVYLTNVGVNLGMAGVIPDKYDGANLTENAVKLVPKKHNTIDGIFLSHYINSRGIQNYINERKMAVGVPKLAIFRIETMPILLPPPKLQKLFADFVHQVDKSKAAVQKALDETQLLFDSLMQEYFG